jgi:hypothetical protein
VGNLKTNLNLTGGIGCLVRGGRHVRLAKVFNSQLVNSGYGIDVIKKEIAKCEVRCSNCHKRKTAREQGWFRG